MGQCLSRWCDIGNAEGSGGSHRPVVHNGHASSKQFIPRNIETFTASTGQQLELATVGQPNTPRSVHVIVPGLFVCQNGTQGTSVRNGISGTGQGDGFIHENCDGCETVFNIYRDPSDDCILADGIEQLCNDLGVKPDDFSILVLAWRFRVSAMCRFTREEFVSGCCSIGAWTIAELAEKLPVIAMEVSNDRTAYRSLYQWSYRFALDHSAGQRTLPVSVAVAMWQVVFDVPAESSGVSCSAVWVVPLWLDFVEHYSGVRGITHDTWDMFLNFIDSLGDRTISMAAYDDTEAWPSLFDDFVFWSQTHPKPVVAAWPETSDQSVID